MIGYGFGYDEELPDGFQDADIEMRELENAANERTSAYWGKTHFNEYTLTFTDKVGTGRSIQFPTYEALHAYCVERGIDAQQAI